MDIGLFLWEFFVFCSGFLISFFLFRFLNVRLEEAREASQ